MKRYEERTIPEKRERCVTETICDLCRKPIQAGYYSADDVTISMDEGSNYPEGAMYETTSYDVCVPCFKSVLMPFMESKGAEPEIREVGR